MVSRDIFVKELARTPFQKFYQREESRNSDPELFFLLA
jgi:hypothetical protein